EVARTLKPSWEFLKQQRSKKGKKEYLLKEEMNHWKRSLQKRFLKEEEWELEAENFENGKRRKWREWVLMAQG
ncbi:indolepyruvate ferredoxin oxidoreductase family protein, partial [Sesbania bispinosa]